MPPEIDAKEQWSLIRDWPENARPVPNMCLFRGEYLAVDDGGGRALNPQLTYHAAVGAGLAWLADEDLSPLLSSIDGKSYVYCASTSCEYEGPTPLAAVSAAVLAAKGGA